VIANFPALEREFFRRVAAPNRLTPQERRGLADRLTYVGSGHHKRHPADYGFQPPVSPRPWKSVCDGIRIITLGEARGLFRLGITMGLFSDFPDDGVPKYVWSVDPNGEPYEAKFDRDGYHGYRLEEEDDMRVVVLREWQRRAG
jgi:hypothetical protein